MKAKDLMIGDYARVNRDGLCIKESSVVVIRGIEADDKLKLEGKCLVGGAHCHPLDEEQFDGGIWCEYLEPIPLTHEILEKNGWKLIPNTRNKLEYSWSTGAIEEYADIHIYVGKDHNNVWRWDFPILNIHLYRGDIELTKFRYVHELQHAIKLCGIEKEIIL